MCRSLHAFLLVPAFLVFFHSTPSFSADQAIITPVISYLLDSKPLMRDTVKKATKQFGSEIDAAVTLLLSANQGYSWRQVIEAIETGKLRADGSISGVTPESRLAARTGTGIQKVSRKYPPETVRAAVEKLIERRERALIIIVRAACISYSFSQVMDAMIEGALMEDGLILCNQDQIYKGLCIDGVKHQLPGSRFLRPQIKERIQLWEDCNPATTNIPDIPPPIIPKGCWRDVPYYVKVINASNGYKYTGRQPTAFGPGIKHSGNIRLTKTNLWEGNLEDEPGYCCGNYGRIWLKMKDENTCSIRSTWFAPDGTVIKDTNWQDLKRDSCENFPE